MAGIDISGYKRPVKKSVGKAESGSVFDILNKDISFGDGQLNDKKKEAFYNETATLLQSGIDVRTALDLVCASFTKEKDRKLFEQIRAQVVAGSSLSSSLEQAGKFSTYEYFGLRIGEETGRIGEVLAELAAYFKSKMQQRRKIVGALTYPVLVLLTSMGAVFFMLRFVVPMFADVFQRFGGQLPEITKIIIGASDWLDRNFYFLVIFFGILFFLYIFNRKSEWFKKHSSLMLLKIPVVGDILQKVYLARFANTMRLLVGTDTPLLHAMGLVRQMIGFYPITHSLEQAEQDILHGHTLSESLAKHKFYPDKFVQLLRIAEEVNKLEYFFGQLSNQYTEEVEYKTNALSSLLEPLIIIFLGLVVGLVLIAMYLPMFQMSNGF